MRDSLLVKLVGGFSLVVIVMSAALFAILSVLSSRVYRGMAQDADTSRAHALAPVLADWYAVEGSWADLDQVFGSVRPSMNAMMQRWGSRRGNRVPMGMLFQSERVVLTDQSGDVLFASISEDESGSSDLRDGEPIIVAGKTVALLYVGSMIDNSLSEAASWFLSTLRLAVLVTSLIVAAIALSLGTVLFRYITSPIRLLRDASQRIANGNLGTRVPERGDDEISQLGRQFNTMAQSVEDSQRRQREFVAEAAHELRTPVSLIQGTLEMIREGVYPADDRRIDLLYEESQRLGALIGDMQQLSMADSGRMQMQLEGLDLVDILTSSAAGFEGRCRRAEVSLDCSWKKDLSVTADGARIAQVLNNLLENAVQHTPVGGSVRLSGRTDVSQKIVVVCVEDTGPGIPPAEAEKVFDRFYRVDRSRSRGSGGSGLGLAIAQEIIRAHSGDIWVATDRASGAAVCFSLPHSPNDESSS